MIGTKGIAALILSLAFSLFTVSNAQNDEQGNEKSDIHQMDHQHKKPHSNYTSEANNEIKALNENELNQLLNGEGMGLAKAAELNNYPGPKHVLDFSSELNLTPEQKEKTETLFKSMKTEAVRLGDLLIAMEKDLDSIFKSKSADEELIRDRVMEISQVKGKLRFVHLDAHLKQKEILTDEQVTAYSNLRGYN